MYLNQRIGPIVNEQALVDALKHKDIEGAALDVYEFEPDITEGLKSLDNVVITPHIGHRELHLQYLYASMHQQVLVH
jgi:lactate dehydrogenase-like 2-hydroxyacid dehydrogenase